MTETTMGDRFKRAVETISKRGGISVYGEDPYVDNTILKGAARADKDVEPERRLFNNELSLMWHVEECNSTGQYLVGANAARKFLEEGLFGKDTPVFVVISILEKGRLYGVAAELMEGHFGKDDVRLPNLWRRQIEVLNEHRSFGLAARVAHHKLNDKSLALTLYLRAGNYPWAAELARELGDDKLAMECSTLAKLYT